jgi:hypothetical protein
MKPSVIKLIGLACLAGAVTIAVAAPPADRDLDLVVLTDLNGNSSAELATLVSEPRGDGGAGRFSRHARIYVRDSSTGAPVSGTWLPYRNWRTLQLIAVPFRDGSLLGALQQHARGDIRVALYNPATGEFIHSIEFLDRWRTAIAVTYVHDTGFGVPGLAVLALNKSTVSGGPRSYRAGEEVMIGIRSLEAGLQLQKLYNGYYPQWDYGYGVTPVAIASVDDQNGNGSIEVAVLARVEDYVGLDTFAVVTRDTYTAEYLSPYYEGNGEASMVYTNTLEQPVGFIALPDVTGDGQAELAVVGFGGQGYRLQVRQVLDGGLVGNRRIYDDWSPRYLRVLGDVDGNGAAEVAVAAVRTDGRIIVDVRDGAAQTLTSRIVFLTADFDPRDLEVLPDQSGNGIEELALVGRNADTGEVRIQIRDAATGQHLRTLWLP